MNVALVVDDSKVVRSVSRRILEALEYEVIEAEDGKVALEQARAHPPSVVFLDWNMPVMDGMEFLKQFRQLKEFKDTKVIFCTTENDFAKIQEAIMHGADEYIMKPYDEQIIKDKLIQIGLMEG